MMLKSEKIVYIINVLNLLKNALISYVTARHILQSIFLLA